MANFRFNLKKHNPGCNCCVGGRFDFHGHIYEGLNNSMRTDLFWRTCSVWPKEISFFTEGGETDFTTDPEAEPGQDPPIEWPSFSYSSITENAFTEYDPSPSGRPDAGGFINAATIKKSACGHDQTGENVWFVRQSNIDSSYATNWGSNLLDCPNNLDNSECPSEPWTTGNSAVYTDVDNVDLLYTISGVSTTGAYLEQEFTIASGATPVDVEVMVIAQRGTVNWIKLSVDNINPGAGFPGYNRHAFAWYDLENLLVGDAEDRVTEPHPVYRVAAGHPQNELSAVSGGNARVEMAGSDHIACFMRYEQISPITPSSLRIQLVSGDLSHHYDGSSGDGAHIYSAHVREATNNYNALYSDICNVDMTSKSGINRQFEIEPNATTNTTFFVYMETGDNKEGNPTYFWYSGDMGDELPIGHGLYDPYGADGWPYGPQIDDMVEGSTYLLQRKAPWPRTCNVADDHFNEVTSSGDWNFTNNCERWTSKSIHVAWTYFNGPLTCMQCNEDNLRFYNFQHPCSEAGGGMYESYGQDTILTYNSDTGDVTTISGVNSRHYHLEYPIVVNNLKFYILPSGDFSTIAPGWGTRNGLDSDKYTGPDLPRIRLASPHDYPNVWSVKQARFAVSHDKGDDTCLTFNTSWLYTVSQEATASITFGPPETSEEWEYRRFIQAPDTTDAVPMIRWPVIKGSSDVFWEASHTQTRLFVQNSEAAWAFGLYPPWHPAGTVKYDGRVQNFSIPADGFGSHANSNFGPPHVWAHIAWADSSTHGETTRGACILLHGYCDVSINGTPLGHPYFISRDGLEDYVSQLETFEYVKTEDFHTSVKLVVGPGGGNVVTGEDIEVWRDDEVWGEANARLRGLIALNSTEEAQRNIINSQGNAISGTVADNHLFAYLKKRYSVEPTSGDPGTGIGWQLNVIKGDGSLVWSIDDNPTGNADESNLIPPVAECYASSDRFFYVRGFPLDSSVVNHTGDGSGWAHTWAFSHYEPEIRFATRFELEDTNLGFDPIETGYPTPGSPRRAKGKLLGAMPIDSIKNSDKLELAPQLPSSGDY